MTNTWKKLNVQLSMYIYPNYCEEGKRRWIIRAIKETRAWEQEEQSEKCNTKPETQHLQFGASQKPQSASDIRTQTQYAIKSRALSKQCKLFQKPATSPHFSRACITTSKKRGSDSETNPESDRTFPFLLGKPLLSPRYPGMINGRKNHCLDKYIPRCNIQARKSAVYRRGIPGVLQESGWKSWGLGKKDEGRRTNAFQKRYSAKRVRTRSWKVDQVLSSSGWKFNK